MKRLASMNPVWLICLVSICVVGFYWLLLASDRYVSRANVVIMSAQVTQSGAGLDAILSGSSSNDLLILRDYLLSVDMLEMLDEELNLRAHYAAPNLDRFSRLSSQDVPIEDFHRYYLRRVLVELDEYAQVLRVSAQACDPETARAIVTLMLSKGEVHMNEMGHRLAEGQVRFIEVQVEDLRDRLLEATDVLLAYQNEHGLVSPPETVQSLSSVVSTLEQSLAKANAKRLALSVSQSERSPDMLRSKSEIEALEKQIAFERARLAQQSGRALNQLASEYEMLNLQVEHTRQLYSSAITALENTRVEAARSLKQVSVLQNPTYPEYSTRPRRLYNATVFAIVALLAALITQLLVAIIRDHRD